MTDRDRRALKMLLYVGLPTALGVAYEYWPQSTPAVAAAPVVATDDAVAAAEKRLAILRDVAATVPAKEEALKKVSAELAAREQGLIRAATAPQAQAEMVTVLRRLLNQEAPPVEIRSTEVGPVTALGDQYGSAAVSVSFECQVAQLINVLAALEREPELISTRDMQITASNPKDKTVRVRLTMVGAVPGKLVPARDKKGVAGL